MVIFFNNFARKPDLKSIFEFEKQEISSKGVEFLPQTLIFYSCISATRSCRPITFQTKNSDRSNILSLKYKRFTASGCNDKVIRTLEFVAKTQLL